MKVYEAITYALIVAAIASQAAFVLMFRLIGKDVGVRVRWHTLAPELFRLVREYDLRFPKGRKTRLLRVLFYTSWGCFLGGILMIARLVWVQTLMFLIHP